MILITGGLGFIGLHTAAAFLDAGESVVVTRHRSGRVPNFLAGQLNRRLFVEPADIADGQTLGRIISKHGVDGIVHLAAPPLSIDSLQAEFQLNLQGLIAVLEAGRIGQVKRITIGSSVAVYRGLENGPFREDAALPLSSRIGVEAFKKSFEILVDYYAHRTGLDIVCLRIGSVYGPLYSSMVNVPSRIVHAAVRKVAGPLPHSLFPQTFTDAGADFIYVEDCALGVQKIQMAPKLKHRIYNLGSGRATTPAEFASAVRRVIPSAEIVLQEGTGPHYRPDAFEDLGRIRTDVEFEPLHSAESAVEKYIEWLRCGNEH
jgi:UDP-glucose 4-epimerase